MIVWDHFLLGIKEISGTSGSFSLVDQGEQCERRYCLLTLKGTWYKQGLSMARRALGLDWREGRKEGCMWFQRSGKPPNRRL